MEYQTRLATLRPPPWAPPGRLPTVAAVWVCFPRGLSGPGAAGDPAWAAAVTMRAGQVVAQYVIAGTANAAYRPGLLALRVGPLLEHAVRGLAVPPEVVLLDATGRDHPRRGGLAVHLGRVLGLPTIGVTHRPLVAVGGWPAADDRAATADLHIDGDLVARWLRTRAGARPLVVHPGWRVDLDTATELVRRWSGHRRTPEPLRRARQLARRSRAAG